MFQDHESHSREVLRKPECKQKLPAVQQSLDMNQNMNEILGEFELGIPQVGKSYMVNRNSPAGEAVRAIAKAAGLRNVSHFSTCFYGIFDNKLSGLM